MNEVIVRLTNRQAHLVFMEFERIARESDDAKYRRDSQNILNRLDNAEHTNRDTAKIVDAVYTIIKARQSALDNLYHSVDAYRRFHSELESGAKEDDGTLSHLYATMIVYLEEAQPLVMPYINEKEE